MGRRMRADLCSLRRKVVMCEFAIESVFVHDPVGLLTLWSSPSVKHQSLLHPNQAVIVAFALKNLFIFSGGFPVSTIRCSIRSHACRILPVSLAEEVPLLLSHLCFFCNIFTS